MIAQQTGILGWLLKSFMHSVCDFILYRFFQIPICLTDLLISCTLIISQKQIVHNDLRKSGLKRPRRESCFMKEYLRETSRQSASLALIYIVTGIVMCFFSSTILTTLVRVIGIALIAYGAYQLYLYFGKGLRQGAFLFYGIPCVIAGAVLIWRPSFLIAFFPIIVGVIMVINGIFQIQKSFMLKDAGFDGWKFDAIGAAVLLAGGIFLVFNPMRTVSWMFKAGGIFLIVEGGFMLWQSFETRKYLSDDLPHKGQNRK